MNPEMILLQEIQSIPQGSFFGKVANPVKILLGNAANPPKILQTETNQSRKDSSMEGSWILQKSFFGNTTIPERILLTTDLRSCKDLKRSMCSIFSRLSYEQNKNKLSGISNFLSPTI